MRALDLDFQPRRYSPAGLALLAAGLLAFGAALWHYRSAAAEAEEWRAELARLQQPPGGRALPKVGDSKEVQQVLQAATAVSRDLRRSWDGLFAAIEGAKSEDIALLSLSPDPGRGAVQISGEARTREAILAFVDRLGQSGALKNVFLAGDQRQEQDPEKPYRFLVTADWVNP